MRRRVVNSLLGNEWSATRAHDFNLPWNTYECPSANCAIGEPHFASRTPIIGGAGGALGPVSSGATDSLATSRSSPGTPSSHTRSVHSLKTATRRPAAAETNAALPGKTSGGIARRPAGVYSCTVPFSKNAAANFGDPTRCVARDSAQRSVHRTTPAALQIKSQCRSPFFASNITGASAAPRESSPTVAPSAAAAANGSLASLPDSSWQCSVIGIARVGNDAAPACPPGASIITGGPYPPPPRESPAPLECSCDVIIRLFGLSNPLTPPIAVGSNLRFSAEDPPIAGGDPIPDNAPFVVAGVMRRAPPAGAGAAPPPCGTGMILRLPSLPLVSS